MSSPVVIAGVTTREDLPPSHHREFGPVNKLSNVTRDFVNFTLFGKSLYRNLCSNNVTRKLRMQNVCSKYTTIVRDCESSRLRNGLKCVEWDVKPYTTNLRELCEDPWHNYFSMGQGRKQCAPGRILRSHQSNNSTCGSYYLLSVWTELTCWRCRL